MPLGSFSYMPSLSGRRAQHQISQGSSRYLYYNARHPPSATARVILNLRQRLVPGKNRTRVSRTSTLVRERTLFFIKFRIGAPRIELGSHAPEACILPLYYAPMRNSISIGRVYCRCTTPRRKLCCFLVRRGGRWRIRTSDLCNVNAAL